MKNLKFKDYKDRIIDELKKKQNKLGIHEKIILLDGFFSQQVQHELSNNVIIGGLPTIPMIAVVGEDSGRIYFFAAKALLPDINM